MFGDNDENEERSPALMEPTALEAITRGEVDIQVATARRFPRDLEKFRRTAVAMACVDVPTAESMWYSLPAREGGEGKEIQGPSVRLAEILASTWGNLRAQARVMDVGATHLIARGEAWDLENNIAVSVEVRRQIVTKKGARFGPNMIQVAANAACAIALRNSLFKVIPRAYTNAILGQAQQFALSGGIDKPDIVSGRREQMFAKFGALGVDRERILAYLDIEVAEEVTLEHLASLIGLYNAIKDGATSADEAFGRPEREEPSRVKAPPRSKVKEAADEPLDGGGAAQASPPESEEDEQARSEWLSAIGDLAKSLKLADKILDKHAGCAWRQADLATLKALHAKLEGLH